MDNLQKFYDVIKKEMGVPFATAAGDSVTMRLISPVYYDGDILMFTEPTSNKYKQLKANPHCCIMAGPYFMEADAEFRGATMLDENKALREIYGAKFTDAFDEGVENGGRNSDFIVLHPKKLTGWAFENDTPTADGVPTVPVEIVIE